MKLNRLTFSENGEGEAIPDTVSVTMAIQEALWVARVSGQQKGESPHNGLYDCLVGDVFNRYWEGGVDDARRQFHFETPPIRYDES